MPEMQGENYRDIYTREANKAGWFIDDSGNFMPLWEYVEWLEICLEKLECVSSDSSEN